MPAKFTLQSYLKNIRTTWAQITQFVVFILGVVGSFLLPPPGWASVDGNKVLVRLAQFIVAVLVGLIFLLVQRWNKKKHMGRWALFAIVFLALSVSAFFAYQHFLDTRTCPYAGRIVVIGTHYTEHGKSYVSENPNSTCTGFLEDFAGEAEDIWTKDSINKSRYILAGLYILSIPLFTICIIAVVQALACSQSKARRQKAGS